MLRILISVAKGKKRMTQVVRHLCMIGGMISTGVRMISHDTKLYEE